MNLFRLTIARARNQHPIVFCIMLATLVLAGCHTPGVQRDASTAAPDWTARFKKNSPEKVEFGKAERMAVVWTDSIASASGVSSVRGFGGRIYFYDRNGKPTRVDGEISVYAFDDSAGIKKTAPDRVYKFRQAELQSHFGETQLGPSYSIWLPWDKVGGDRKSITLVPVFKAVDNQIVKSEQSINVLPGKSPTQLAESTQRPYRVLGASSTLAQAIDCTPARSETDYGVQLTSYNPPASDPAANQRIRSSTIDVPRQMTKRLNQDFAHGTIDNVAAGMQAQVSFGPRNPASWQAPASTPSGDVMTSAEATQSKADSTATQASPLMGGSRSRQIFGAPGAYK